MALRSFAISMGIPARSSERSGKRATEKTQLAGPGVQSTVGKKKQARSKRGRKKFKIKMRRDAGYAGRPVYRDELTFVERGKLTLTANEMLAEPEKKKSSG